MSKVWVVFESKALLTIAKRKKFSDLSILVTELCTTLGLEDHNCCITAFFFYFQDLSLSEIGFRFSNHAVLFRVAPSIYDLFLNCAFLCFHVSFRFA